LTFGVHAAVAASSSASNDVEPGVLGFLVVAAIGVALVFLLRSMNKQFRKITPNPEPPGSPAQGKAAQGETAQGETARQEAPK
jgi:phosphatidylserine decarboxylase